uniref:RRM domain-containing protein n=1 Tax=Chrysotila carterae TaxID=13221 RepID=A0A6S9SJX0_CHRCT|mmetsp:Transcript_23270/g.50881  ORF Transcript_23270/g.50881 Transcript_23270/m.50881 type:complete len:223 (+) Transcript_23270:3-671(+)
MRHTWQSTMAYIGGDMGNRHDPATASMLAAEAASLHQTAENAALIAARAEINALKAENNSLKAEIAAIKAGAPANSLIAPPVLWPPQGNSSYGSSFSPYGASPYGAPGYGMPGVYGAAAPPARPPVIANPKRGPKGANLAIFCIPNSYTEQQVYDLASPYGTVTFVQIATHRDTGASRGYAFVSYDTVEAAENAIANMNNMTVEGRQLRVEVGKADKGEKPY